MAMGPAACALAVCILASGSLLNVESTRLADPESQLFAVTRKQFMAGGFANLFVFVAMMGVGLWRRRRPEIHRPMMLLATLGLLAAAIGRIDTVTRLYQGTASRESLCGFARHARSWGDLFLCQMVDDQETRQVVSNWIWRACPCQPRVGANCENSSVGPRGERSTPMRDLDNGDFLGVSTPPNKSLHVRTGNGLMTSGCDSRVGKR